MLTGREILSFLGQCQAALPALQMAPLHFRAIQRDLIQVISPQGDRVNYKKAISLSKDAIKDLLWWTQGPAQANSRVIIPTKVDSVIFLDASRIEWGSSSSRISIGRRWKKLEAPDHINYSQSFSASDKGESCPVWPGQPHCGSIHQLTGRNEISTPHSTGTRHMVLRSRQEHGNISNHVPGKWSRTADGKSRIFHDSIEWMLDHNLFKQVTKHLGLPVVDLFASWVNHQMPEFVSWRPEPGAIATDAFNIAWDFPLSYLFPPFCLIPMRLRKVMQEQVDRILIAPVWRSRSWYPALLPMLIERPLLLPQGQRILKLPGTDKIHPLCCQKKFQSAAWKISGKLAKQRLSGESVQNFIILQEKKHSQAI